MKRLIISAPFGNVLRFPGTTPTLGTYTLARRAGFIKRLWRVLWTVRYSWRTQAWVNRLGLPNPGINSLIGPLTGSILSIHGLHHLDWGFLAQRAIKLDAEKIELNLSCPNVESREDMLRGALLAKAFIGDAVVAKLPPVRWMDLGEPLYVGGVRHFHLCNTVSSPGGGISGKPLQQYSRGPSPTSASTLATR